MADEFESDVLAARRGARFVRADLHIHSYTTGLDDVKDSGMTAEAIVATAKAAGLGVIAITDHNHCSNVERAIAAAGTDLLVVPGVELSTPAGHFLVYAETLDLVQGILGKLEFSKDRLQCRTSAFEVLKAAEAHDGVVIAAHIDLDKGLELQVPGYGDAKESVLLSKTLVALEIASGDTSTWYTESDSDPSRLAIVRKRRDLMAESFAAELPKIQSSDAHTLAAIGRNYTTKKKHVTRLKVESLEWSSFRNAFADPEARVRFEEDVPDSVPRILGIRFGGGFLDGQTLPISDNLTCIIGGRGSGKSTALESLRAACGFEPSDRLAQSDVWPEQIDLLYEDELGEKTHIVVRDGQREDAADSFSDPATFHIEGLGQGEMARTIEQCGKDPEALLLLLDSLLQPQLGEMQEAAEETREELIRNGDEIQRLEVAVANYNEVKKQLEFKQKQSQTAKREKSEELVVMQQQLARSITIRERLLPTFSRAVEAVKTGLDEETLSALEEMAETAGSLVENPVDNPLPGVIDKVQSAISDASTKVGNTARECEEEIRAFVEKIRARQQPLEEKIAKKAEELRQSGILLDLKFLRSLATEVERLESQMRSLNEQKKLITKLRTERTQLVKRYRGQLASVYQRRNGLAVRLQAKLRAIILEMEVDMSFYEGRHAVGASERLKEIMAWRTSEVPKAQALVRLMGMPALLDAIERRDRPALLRVKRKTGETVLVKADVDALMEAMARFENLRLLQECAYADFPLIRVTRAAVDATGARAVTAEGAPRMVQREFSHLSLGQQQSVILAILLSSDSRYPLVIDQPEDNLDSAFVYRILVRSIRRIKERRQVILVTHNANIAVLSDTDLVLPLKATADLGVLIAPGTIDSGNTRDAMCEILEGGRAAFARRSQLYGSA